MWAITVCWASRTASNGQANLQQDRYNRRNLNHPRPPEVLVRYPPEQFLSRILSKQSRATFPANSRGLMHSSLLPKVLLVLISVSAPCLAGGPIVVGGPATTIDGQPFVWDLSQGP